MIFSKTFFKRLLSGSILSFLVLGGAFLVSASAPAGGPPPAVCPPATPGCNTPLNVGATSQTKSGKLGLDGLTLFTTFPTLGFTDEDGSAYQIRGNGGKLLFQWDSDADSIPDTSVVSITGGAVDPVRTLDVSGGVEATKLCLSNGCIDHWPTSGGGGDAELVFFHPFYSNGFNDVEVPYGGLGQGTKSFQEMGVQDVQSGAGDNAGEALCQHLGVYNDPDVPYLIAAAPETGSTDRNMISYGYPIAGKFSVQNVEDPILGTGVAPGNPSKKWMVGCSDQPYDASNTYNISYK